jgi:SRSO17 transposase
LVQSWDDGLGDLLARIAGRFARVQPPTRAFAYVRGLLAPLERHNGWTLALRAGDGSPDGMQALLCSPCWDRDAVRDEARGYVVDHIGDPDGVLIADETGVAKKARLSAGVQRQ